MVRNDFTIDMKVLMRKENKTQRELGSEIGISGQAVSMRTYGKVISPGYVELCDALGYDIEVRYIKREQERYVWD